MNGSKNPCYKCESRHVGCHSDCDMYIAWKKETCEVSEAKLATDYYAMKDTFQSKFKRFNGPYRRRG